MSNAAVLEIEGLTVIRGATEVLSNVDWRVLPGEHWVVFGANGSGKTTLLSSLLTYVPRARGCLRVLGQTHGADDWRELRKRVGIVSDAILRLIPEEDQTLDVVISGHESQLGAWGPRDPALVERAMALLDQVECRELARRRFGVLSQGERQRVMIARASMAEPPLLILDEPCSGLDVVARERFLEFLDRLGRSPDAPTLVLVTHHVEEISSLFTHVLLLKHGTVLARGARDQVMTSERVSEALGASLVLRRQGARYSLTLSHDAGKIV